MTRPRLSLLQLAPALVVLIAWLPLRAEKATEANAKEPATAVKAAAHAPAAPAAPAPPAAGHETPAGVPAAPGAAHAGESPTKPEANSTSHATPAPTAKAEHGTAPVAPSPAPKGQKAEEVESLLKLGTALTDRGDYDAAEIAFHQVLRMRGVPEADIKTALLGLARMHRKQGALTKAVAIYERFLKDYPVDDRAPDALLDLGRTLRSLGIHRLAIARFYSVLNSTLKISGGNFDHYQLLAKTAQFEIAQTHFEAGAFEEANKYFTRLRLLDLAPGDRARAHFMAAKAQRLQGNREGAVSSLRAFIDQSPNDENVPEARYLQAVTLRELRRPQEALAATLELLRAEKSRTSTDPKRWAYWQRRTGNQLANDFYEAGDTLNAHAIYTGLLELASEPSWRLPLMYQIGLCFERLGITDRARSTYQGIVTAAGANPPPEFAELARIAAWRLDHLSWRDQVDKQVTSFFATTTGKTAATPPFTSPPTEASPPAAPATPTTP